MLLSTSKMRSLLGFILFCVLLNVVLSKNKLKNGGQDWVWKKTEREFLRNSVEDSENATENGESPWTPYWQPTTEETTTEGPTTEEPTTEGPTTERPTSEEPPTERPTSEEPPTEAPTTEEPTTEEPTTEEPTTTENLYYKHRKIDALNCTGTEYFVKKDEFGCQWCTCNGVGVMLCTKIDCNDESVRTDIEEEHEKLFNNAVNTNLILREYATNCKQDSTVEVGRCTCSCVLPGVLSCPKSCFYSDDVTTMTTEEYTTTTESTTANIPEEIITIRDSDYGNPHATFDG